MRRRDLQIGLVKALGGGFDATAVGLAAPPASPAAASDATQTQARTDGTTTAASAQSAN
jgi:hypothetical protein